MKQTRTKKGKEKMKRSELTYEIMKDMGWKSTNKSCTLEDIVRNIKTKDTDGTYVWTYLRCTKSEDTYVRTEYGMCSTYEINYKYESLEVSVDKIHWYEVAKRPIEINRRCTYAD